MTAMVEHRFCSSERYAFDFSEAYKTGEWRQYDTDQDAWYYGVWFSPATLQVLTYAEGDLTLTSFDDWNEFKGYIAKMDEFHGGPPPSMVTGSGIGVDMKLENATAFYDVNARLRPDENQPERAKPIRMGKVLVIFSRGAS